MKWLMMIPLLMSGLSVLGYKKMTNSLPKSLSALSLYGKKGKIVFKTIIILSAVCIWLCCASVIPEYNKWMAWATCASLFFVAFLPIEEETHSIMARLAGVMVTALSAVVCPLSLLVWALFVFYAVKTDGRCNILVAEGCCLLEIVITIFSI